MPGLLSWFDAPPRSRGPTGAPAWTAEDQPGPVGQFRALLSQEVLGPARRRAVWTRRASRGGGPGPRTDGLLFPPRVTQTAWWGARTRASGQACRPRPEPLCATSSKEHPGRSLLQPLLEATTAYVCEPQSPAPQPRPWAQHQGRLGGGWGWTRTPAITLLGGSLLSSRGCRPPAGVPGI